MRILYIVSVSDYWILGGKHFQVSYSAISNCSNTEEDDESEFMFTPSIELPHVFELSYYANTVTSTFALESVIGKKTKKSKFYKYVTLF